MDLPALDPLEQRVLGCLLEKELSTPDVYPLSMNALLHACIQSSNRDPVMQLAEEDLQAPVARLVALGLAEPWPGRVPKVAHLAKQRWNLSVQEGALLAELLLRGPQTPGELRVNTRRMYPFPDMSELEACLQALMEAEPPLAERLPRAPGAREARIRHGLGELGEAVQAPQAAPRPEGAGTDRLAALEQEVAELREALADLRAAFEAFRAQF